jgi:hypothetical protein
MFENDAQNLSVMEQSFQRCLTQEPVFSILPSCFESNTSKNKHKMATFVKTITQKYLKLTHFFIMLSLHLYIGGWFFIHFFLIYLKISTLNS